MWPPAPNPPSLTQLDDDVVKQFGDDLLILIQVPLRGAESTLNSVSLPASSHRWRAAIVQPSRSSAPTSFGGCIAHFRTWRRWPRWR